MTQLSIRNICKTYPNQDKPVLSNLSLEVEKGSLTTLLGPSGCGKTTLLKIITGLLEPTAGDILLDGESILQVVPEKRNAVMVFQNHLLFPHLSVADNIGFGLRMRGIGKDEITSRVQEILALVHLQGMEQRKPAALSGGQQQRVALARALVVKPRLLLLDEPLSNLDAHLRLEMRDFIHDLQRETKVTCVLVTHDQEEAVALADRVALLLDGQLQQYTTPQDYYEKPASLAVAKFFGAQNFLPGTHDGTRFRCSLGELAVRCPGPPGNYTAVLRPERIVLVSPDTPGSLPGKVLAATYLGTSWRLVVAVNTPAAGPHTTLTLTCKATNRQAFAQGVAVTLAISPDAVWLV